MSEFLTVFGNAIWVGAAGAGIFFGLKSDIRQLRSDIKNAVLENREAHERFEEKLDVHEARIRAVERVYYKRVRVVDG